MCKWPLVPSISRLTLKCIFPTVRCTVHSISKHHQLRSQQGFIFLVSARWILWLRWQNLRLGKYGLESVSHGDSSIIWVELYSFQISVFPSLIFFMARRYCGQSMELGSLVVGITCSWALGADCSESELHTQHCQPQSTVPGPCIRKVAAWNSSQVVSSRTHIFLPICSPASSVIITL